MLSMLVSETDLNESYISPKRRRLHGSWHVSNVWHALQQIDDSFAGSAGLSNSSGVLGEILYGTEHIFKISQKHQQVARRQFANQHLRRAIPEHQGTSNGGEQIN